MKKFDTDRSANAPPQRPLVGAVPFCLLLFVLILPAIGWTAERTIVLGIYENGWPPYLIAHANGTNSGIAVDVFAAICRGLNVPLRVERYPDRRGLLMLNNKKVDAWPDAKEWTLNPERFVWSDIIVDSTDLLVFKKDRQFRFEKVQDLFGTQIGTRKNYVYPLLDAYFADGRIIRVDAVSETSMLKMVFLQRTDAAVINKLTALWRMKADPSLNKDMFVFSQTPVGQAGYRFMFNTDPYLQAFVARFNAKLKGMKRDGRLARIVNAYR